jgi:hypothetical protein
MLRWPLRIIVTLLFLTCATLWVRSYWVFEVIQHEKTTQEGLTFTTKQRTIASGRGGLFFNHSQSATTVPTEAQAEKRAAQPAKNGWERHRLDTDAYAAGFFERTRQSTRLGFGRHSHQSASTTSALKTASYVFPWALPTLLLFLLPLKWLFRLIFPPPKQQRKLIASPEFADNDYLRSPHEPFAPRT